MHSADSITTILVYCTKYQFAYNLKLIQLLIIVTL